MNENGAEFVEIFLGEASERLQFLREYSGILQDAYPPAPEVERLYIAAHTLSGTSASYGFPLFSEIAGKLAHIFQYAMNATIAAACTDNTNQIPTNSASAQSDELASAVRMRRPRCGF